MGRFITSGHRIDSELTPVYTHDSDEIPGFPQFSEGEICVNNTQIVIPAGGAAVTVGFRRLASIDGFEKLHDKNQNNQFATCPNQPQWMCISNNLTFYATRVAIIDPDSTAELGPNFPVVGEWRAVNVTMDFFVKRDNPGFVRYVMQVATNADRTTILGQATYRVTSSV